MRKVFVALLLILVVVLGLAIHAYSSLNFAGADVASVRPAFKSDVASVLRAGAAALRGDLLPAAGSLIDGAELDIKLKVENNGFVPVYLPVLKHQIAVTGAQVTDSVVSRGVWLGPRSATPVELSAVVPFKQLPKAALAVLTSGGIIEMEVHSAMELGGLVLTKRSQIFRVSVAETIESRVKSIIGR